MRRREFITLLGGAATAWPIAVHAQQPSQMRRIGMLTGFTSDDPGGQVRLTAFAQGLQQLGWTVGRNVRIETRWGAGDAERYRRYAAELVALAPDVILVGGGSVLAAAAKCNPHCADRFCECHRPGRRWIRRKPWRGRAPIQPDLLCSNTAQAGNGWSCSKRSRPA